MRLIAKSIAVFTFCLFFHNSFSQGWVEVTPAPLFSSYLDFSFPAGNTGYGLGSGLQLIKTTNAGQSWTVQNSSFVWSVTAFHFIDLNTGFAAGEGAILKTTNAGGNWNQVLVTPFNLQVYDITFTNANTGYACAYNRIFRTTDQGNSWDTVTSGLPQNILFTVDFVNSNTGFVSGTGGIYKTTNSGATWENCLSRLVIQAFDFANANVGFACDYNEGKIFRTLDGGITWDTVYSDTLLYYTLQAVTPDSVYIGCKHSIVLKTNNSGAVWYRNLLGTNHGEFVQGLKFINGKVGVASGGQSFPFLFYTVSGGTVGISQIGTEIPAQLKLYANYPNPFNPSTKIKFDISMPSHIKMDIYSMTGEKVASLIDRELSPGQYSMDWDAGNYAGGVYFCRLQDGNSIRVQKMILLK